ncbi:importin alpha isoform 4 [Actinidia rufa]|uniref:Importin alpha isoform 4 n=1 Tax=Actinidia rufa TaxID=165716 RepID=A0A7J0GGJ1_9ERIC|nr:importin alpha isoform 4 [Actinidia rufa]
MRKGWQRGQFGGDKEEQARGQSPEDAPREIASLVSDTPRCFADPGRHREEGSEEREMGSTDQSESQALVSEGSRERGRGQGRGHHRAATKVMAVDEDEIDVLLGPSDDGKSDWILDSSSSYHLCRDRKVFSTYAAYEGRIWMSNNTSSRVVGRESVRFRMADGRSVTLTEIGGATVRHGSSGISKESGQGKQPSHKGTQSKRRGLGGSVMVLRGSEAVQEHRELLWDMYKSLARHK